MIIIFCSQKGGCGKSTLATNFSAALSTQKKDVLLVDADAQKTAGYWAEYREENPSLSQVHTIQKYGNIRSTLLDLKKRYPYVLVDLPGRDSRESRTAMTAADLLLLPLKTSQADLDTLPKMQQLLEETKDFNPRIQIKLLLTMASTNPLVTEKEECIRHITENYPDFPVMKTIIHERKSYRDALSEGKGVVELENAKAKEEIHSLMNEVFGD